MSRWDKMEQAGSIEIYATDHKYMHKVKKNLAFALNRRDISGIQYSISDMRIAVFKGLGKGWIVYDLILKNTIDG